MSTHHQQNASKKLKALQRAAKWGFDEIDLGAGNALKDKRALAKFFNEIESEVLAKRCRKGK